MDVRGTYSLDAEGEGVFALLTLGDWKICLNLSMEDTSCPCWREGRAGWLIASIVLSQQLTDITPISEPSQHL